MVLRRKNRKFICDEESLKAVLVENANQALLWPTVLGEKEFAQLGKWVDRARPATVSETSFLMKVRAAMEVTNQEDCKIVKIPLYPEMNIKRYIDSEGLISQGFSLDKLEIMVEETLSDKTQVARVATSEEVYLLKAYKVATNAISLKNICEYGNKVDKPREFYRDETGFAFSGGKIWSVVDVQSLSNPMITIQTYDYLTVVIKNK